MSLAQSTLDDLTKQRAAAANSKARFEQVAAEATANARDCEHTIAALDLAIEPLLELSVANAMIIDHDNEEQPRGNWVISLIRRIP